MQTLTKKIIEVLTSNRFQSFYWRAGMMFLASFLALLAENIELFELSAGATMVLGLVLGELSKALHNAYQGKEMLGINKSKL